MYILGSADFVGHVTMLEMKKFMITDHSFFSTDLIDFRSNLLFFCCGIVSRVIEVPKFSRSYEVRVGTIHSYNTSVVQWILNPNSSSQQTSTTN